MNVLNKLTKKNLTLNKKRTIVTIIGIILSTALIVCVSGMVTSFQKTLVNATMQKEGNYHVLIEDMSKSDLIALENNRNIEDYYVMNNIGYAKFDSLNEYKPYIYVRAFDEKALHHMGIALIEGRLPENDSEILISNHLIMGGGYDKKIGDTITLNIGTRYVYDEEGKRYELGQNNPVASESDEEEFSLEEEFVAKAEKSYTIVGIMERLNYTFEEYSAPGYTCITYLDGIEGSGSAALLYKNPKNYAEQTKEIAQDKYDYTYNRELLRYLGVTDSPTMNALYVIASIVIGIIIISSVFVIKNSFDISITEKYKMYGMLRSVGATSKQIKKNVLFEGFILGLISIPIGILCGIIAVVVLIFLINFILGDYLNGIHFVYSIPLFPIVLSIVLAAVTIYFSTIFIARRVAKISAIEAIRSNNEIKIKRKKLRTPWLVRKLFKTGGVIAYKNLKRNKKKYRTTVISIVVSIFVFISLSSFIDFGFKMTTVYYKEVGYNMMIWSDIDVEDDLATEIFEKIRTDSLVENYSILRFGFLKINTEDYLSDYGRKIWDYYKYGEDSLTIRVVAVGEQEFNRYLKELGLNSENSKNKGILIDEHSDTIDKKNYIGNLYNFKNNDILSGQSVFYNDGDLETEKDFSIEIIRFNVRPMGLESSYSLSGHLVVSDKVLEENFHIYDNGSLYLKVSDTSKMEKNIDHLMKENSDYGRINYENIDEYMREMNAMILIVSIFLYGFITVISLIGITNIFNTITTNMNLRSKEFAMLKSVGMTKKEFNRMIRLESIFYGTKALIIGIPLGLAGSYLIYRAFVDALEMEYIFPVKSLVIVVIFVAIIIGIIMRYSLRKINKQNIIETIRNDNI